MVRTTRHRASVATLLAGCLAVACSDSDASTGRAERDDAGLGEIDVIEQHDASIGPHVVVGTINLFEVGMGDPMAPGGMPAEPTGLPGVEVCELDTDNCVLTNSLGNYNLEVIPDPRGSVITRLDGYYPVIVPASIGADDIGWQTSNLLPDALMELFASALMTPWPNEEQGIAVVILTEQVTDEETGVTLSVTREGATIELVKGEAGPRYYGNEMAIPMRELEATTTAGWGGFLEFPPSEPGDFEIEYSVRENQQCSPVFAFPGSKPNTVTGPVRAGSFTYFTVNCRPLE